MGCTIIIWGTYLCALSKGCEKGGNKRTCHFSGGPPVLPKAVHIFSFVTFGFKNPPSREEQGMEPGWNLVVTGLDSYLFKHIAYLASSKLPTKLFITVIIIIKCIHCSLQNLTNIKNTKIIIIENNSNIHNTKKVHALTWTSLQVMCI